MLSQATTKPRRSFWKLALPIMGVLLPLFLANDIYKAVHHIKKKFTERRITKVRGCDH